MINDLVEVIRIIDLNLFSAVVLMVLLAFVPDNFIEHQRTGNNLFLWLVSLTLFLTLLDSISWICQGQQDNLSYIINKTSNLLLFIFSPGPAMAWLLYVFFNLSGSQKRTRRFMLFCLPVLAINNVIAGLSLKNGWYFSINQDNIYVRGPLFALSLLPHYLFLAASVLMILANKENEDPLVSKSLLLFILPPLIGTILQSIFYGLVLYWPSITLAILMLYIRIQSRNLFTDPLTGAYNRRHFERIISYRVNRSGPEGLALIIADLDNFKQINDLYGHQVGDEALLKAVELFRQTLRRSDLIARFGGDEFYILLDINDEQILQEKVRRIVEVFAQFNRQASVPYQLSVSAGAAVYDQNSQQTAQEFIHFVDQLMYVDKLASKKRQVSFQDSLIEQL